MVLAVTRRSPALLVALLIAASITVLPVAPADAAVDAAAEVDFACRANAARKSAGVSSLRVAADLTKIARNHSVTMANKNSLHHNPNLAKDVTGWTVVGENVGRGSSVAGLHKAFMDSAGHRRNLLDSRFKEVGMGVEVRGTTIWITQVFRRPTTTSQAPLPKCSTAPTTTSTTPVVGDWNGDGLSTPGDFRDGRWELSNGLSSKVDIAVTYGRKGDIPIVGDWNGDGKDTLGVVRDGTWHLKNSISGGASDTSFKYGRVTRGDIPIVGNWNGLPGDGVGIIRDGDWHLRLRPSGGPGEIVFRYGRISRGDVPLVGDWNSDGRETIGIVRGGDWHLRNTLSGGAGQIVFQYGRVLRGDRPVIGDWNRDDRSGIGVVRGSEWHLRNTLSGGPAELQFRF